MTGSHHRLNGQEFEQTPGDSEGQGGLVCWGPWAPKELDRTQQLNSNTIQFLHKNPPGSKEPTYQAGDMCWEDPLEKEMATHSSMIAWEIPWTEEPSGPQSMRSQRV